MVLNIDTDGDELYGVIYYPLDYHAGTTYPTIFIVYEDFFDDRFGATISFLTSNGYAVVQPSVDLERGFPGEAWLKGVTAAAINISGKTDMISFYTDSTPTHRGSAPATSTRRSEARTASGPRSGSSRTSTSSTPPSCTRIASRRPSC